MNYEEASEILRIFVKYESIFPFVRIFWPSCSFFLCYWLLCVLQSIFGLMCVLLRESALVLMLWCCYEPGSWMLGFEEFASWWISILEETICDDLRWNCVDLKRISFWNLKNSYECHRNSCNIHTVLEFLASLIRFLVEREGKFCFDDVYCNDCSLWPLTMTGLFIADTCEWWTNRTLPRGITNSWTKICKMNKQKDPNANDKTKRTKNKKINKIELKKVIWNKR
jgi:hypothetical protein